MSVVTELVCEQGPAVQPAWGVGPISETTSSLPALDSTLLAALVNQEHLGVGVCGPDGVLTMLSPALEEMLGQKYVAAAPSTWSRRHQFHDGNGRPLGIGEDPLARALRGETVTAQVICIRRPRRAARFLRCNAFQLSDPDRGLVGAVVLVVDITDKVVEQTRLDHLRDRLVTAVNHEVRTPLAVIMGHLELITEQDTSFPEELAWSLGAIDRATGHMAEVVETISEIADESLADVLEGVWGNA